MEEDKLRDMDFLCAESCVESSSSVSMNGRNFVQFFMAYRLACESSGNAVNACEKIKFRASEKIKFRVGSNK